MKTSTKRDSSSEPIKGVRGVIFFNPAYKPRHVTVAAWVEAGKPPSCFVYDGAHQLISAGIPIVDAVEVEGRWIRTAVPIEIPPTHYKRTPSVKRKIVRTSRVELTEFDFVTASGIVKRKLR